MWKYVTKCQWNLKFRKINIFRLNEFHERCEIDCWLCVCESTVYNSLIIINVIPVAGVVTTEVIWIVNYG